MKWLERAICALGGGVATASVLIWTGRLSVKIEGDVAANVLGATIGGLIAVGLAVVTARQERANAVAKEVETARVQHEAALLQSLRYVRAIRDCISRAEAMTVLTAAVLIGNIKKASDIAHIALQDPGLTDFPLRNATDQAMAIANRTAAAITNKRREYSAITGDAQIPEVDATCKAAVAELDQIISDFRNLRETPPTF